MKKPSTSPARAHYHHGDLPTALLEAALRRVTERGEDFSLREVARDVGVDPSAVYRHFKDKGDLLAAVARAGFARMATQMERTVAQSSDPRERLRAVGLSYVKFAQRNPDHFRVMFGREGAGNAARVSVQGTGERGKNPYEILTATLKELDGERRLPLPLKRAALVAWCGVHGLASLVVDGAWRPSKEQTLETAVDTLVEALVTPR